MEEFVIKNPRWDVIGKYISIIPLTQIVETGWVVPGRPFSFAELNALAQKHLPAVIRLLKIKTFHLEEENIPQYADDIIIIYLLILIEFKNRDSYSKIPSIEDVKTTGLFFKNFGTVIEAIEYSFQGYRFKLVPYSSTGDKLEFESLTLPPQFNHAFLKELKATYYRDRDKITPIFKKNVDIFKVVRDSLIVSLFEYMNAEIKKSDKKQCAYFISNFSNQIDLPFKSIDSGNVLKIANKYRAKKKKEK